MAGKKEKTDTKKKAKVFLVDDHPVVRQGLGQLINQQRDLIVCGEAEGAVQALKAISASEPDVAVIDISLNKDISGIELIKDIKTQFPKLFVLVLSMHEETVFAERALRAGARGYVMKQEAMETVLTAIRQVLNGQIYVSDRMAKKLLSGIIDGPPGEGKFPVERLTNRELEVFQLIGRGIGTSQIADKLCLSVKTVEVHRAHIKEKLNIKNPRELVPYAIQWVQADLGNL